MGWPRSKRQNRCPLSDDTGLYMEERPHICAVCQRGFKTTTSLRNHVNTHTGTKPYCCHDCDASFTTSGELVRHVRYRHTHEKPHHCTECDYASVEASKMKRHMLTHSGERPFKCPACSYASADIYKLKRHIRIHTGEKPYECDICQSRFNQSNTLKTHMKVHTNESKGIKCEFCSVRCRCEESYKSHVERYHTKVTCKRYEGRFLDKQHSKTHQKGKYFKCNLCSYFTGSERHFEAHRCVHVGIKKFRCDDCDLTFRKEQLLCRHKMLCHKRSYSSPDSKVDVNKCNVCGAEFMREGNLLRHLNVHISNDEKENESSQVPDESVVKQEEHVVVFEIFRFQSEERLITTFDGDNLIIDNGDGKVTML